jgi:dihydroorotate dehydrogenase electron transfer subunit
LGIAPLLFLSQELINKNISVVLFWGNRSKDAFAIVPDFESGGIKTYLATDDGSLGFKGTITELFQTQFQALNRSRVEIFACGPNVMLQQLKQISAHANLPCQVSLETMMACGFGACMGCNVSSNLEPDGFKYVCKHGPVFNTGEIEISD